MTRRVIHAIGPSATIEEAAKRMRDAEKGCLVVMKGTRPAGIITERDITYKVTADSVSPTGTKVSQVMTELTTIGPEALVSTAASVMMKKGIRSLVVTEGGNVVGILTSTDLVRLLAR